MNGFRKGTILVVPLQAAKKCGLQPLRASTFSFNIIYETSSSVARAPSPA